MEDVVNDYRDCKTARETDKEVSVHPLHPRFPRAKMGTAPVYQIAEPLLSVLGKILSVLRRWELGRRMIVCYT